MTVLDALNRAYDRYYQAPASRVVLKESRFDSIGGVPGVGTLQQHFEIQEAIRPLFGKGASASPTIGDHPDFEHLRATGQTEFAPITTLFMDMEGSTRLGLIYPPATVFRIKNAVIQSTIDIIKAFDGHVHRIMGDAVMAYFGKKGAPVEQGAIDALNCAATLRAMVGALVGGRYDEMKEEKFGIRIGLDHGPADAVLWGSYGYPGMEEVTATSYFVDVASKLQHSAGRNQIMLGQSIRDLLDLPDVLLDRKTFVKNGAEEAEPYVLPNYSGADGKPINYKKYVLKWEQYLRCTKLASVPGLLGGDADLLRITIGVADERKVTSVNGAYAPCGGMLPKRKELMFDVRLPYQPRLPFTYDFRVENHGAEASRAANNGDHEDHQEKTKLGDLAHVHWESTLYRGLHYLDVVVRSQGTQIMSSRIGIWVE